MADVQRDIASLLSEERVFEPSEEFRSAAVVQDRPFYEHADADHEASWAKEAERLDRFERWDTVMDWKPPWVTWFAGGKLERLGQLPGPSRAGGRGDKVAYHWEGEPGEQRTSTYRELVDEVCRFANALRAIRRRPRRRVSGSWR